MLNVIPVEELSLLFYKENVYLVHNKNYKSRNLKMLCIYFRIDGVARIINYTSQ